MSISHLGSWAYQKNSDTWRQHATVSMANLFFSDILCIHLNLLVAKPNLNYAQHEDILPTLNTWTRTKKWCKTQVILRIFWGHSISHFSLTVTQEPSSAVCVCVNIFSHKEGAEIVLLALVTFVIQIYLSTMKC